MDPCPAGGAKAARNDRVSVAKKNLLLVDADPRSLRVLEVSLRKAGYNVASCGDAEEALDMIGIAMPDLILSDTRLPKMDGFQFAEELHRRSDEVAEVPFMFLSSDGSVESKVRGLELGVDDYLTKPIYIKEILTRVNLELTRRQREGIGRQSTTSAKTRFSGSLADMGLVDLLQTIDISRKSGVAYLTSGSSLQGAISFKDGRILDAELGSLRGEAAIYRFLIWNEGTFDIEFRDLEIEKQVVQTSTQGLLMEGMRRVDEWGRMLEQLPPLDRIFQIDHDQLFERLGEIPDEINTILRNFDGRNTLLEVVNESGGDDLETLAAISKLYFEGLVFDTGFTGLEEKEELDDRELVGDAGLPASEPIVRDEELGETVVPGDPSAEPAGSGTEGTHGLIADPDSHKFSDVTHEHDSENAAEPLSGSAVAQEKGSIPIQQESSADVSNASHSDQASLAHQASGEDLEHVRAEGASMAKKRRRQKKSKRPTPLATANEAANNVIQFPGAQISSVPRADDPTPVGNSELSVDALNQQDEAATRESGVLPAALKDEDPDESPSARRRMSPQQRRRAKKHRKASKAPSSNGQSFASSDDALATRSVIAPSSRESEESPEENLSDPPEVDEAGVEGSPTPVEEASIVVDSDFQNEVARRSYPASPRKKRKRIEEDTTSSQMIRALTDTGMHKSVTEDFFSKPPEALDEDWADYEIPVATLSPDAKKARSITFMIFVLMISLIGGFVLFKKLSEPDPEPLGAFRELEMPNATESTEADSLESDFASEEPTRAESSKQAGSLSIEEPLAPDLSESTASEESPEPEITPADLVLESVSEDSPEYTDAIDEGKRSEARGARQKAEEAYRRAVDIDPRGAEALTNLAFLLLHRGANGEARDLALRATDVDETSAKAWITLGAALQALRQREPAMEAYRSCVELGQGPMVRECRLMLR